MKGSKGVYLKCGPLYSRILLWPVIVVGVVILASKNNFSPIFLYVFAFLIASLIGILELRKYGNFITISDDNFSLKNPFRGINDVIPVSRISKAEYFVRNNYWNPVRLQFYYSNSNDIITSFSIDYPSQNVINFVKSCGIEIIER